MQLKGIKSWSENDRPREKFNSKGGAALSDAEIIAILLGTGTAQKTALDLARDVLQFFDNDLLLLARASITDLMQIKGIGMAKAIGISASLELGKRKSKAVALEKKGITSSQMVYQYLQPYLSDLQHEEFYVLYLNNKNEIITHKQISKGGMTSTIADGKIIFRNALQFHATALILSHNHPSGNKKASQQDIELTKSLMQFSKCIDIKILDHLIFTDNGYFSFADNDMMNS